jgi:small subunit ribosomal protein S2
MPCEQIQLGADQHMAEIISVRELLEAGAHFGHQVSYWHPKMKDYIFTQRNGIHIIDLEKTVAMLEKAYDFVRDLVASGQTIVLVGTKRQAQNIVEEEAKRCGMCYVNQRWIGGTLTNFATIQTRIDYLVRLEEKRDKGEFDYLSKKERAKLEREIIRLNKRLGSLKEMTSLPGALFIVDPIKDKIALIEARTIGIPVVAIADTNCNPTSIDHPVPANDDAIKAIKLVCSKMADAVIEGRAIEETSQVPVVELPAEPEMELEITGSFVFNPEEE